MLGRYLCRLLVVGCDRSQCLDPKWSARLRGKVAHGYWIRNQQPRHFQSSYYGEKVTWPATLEFWSKLATAFLFFPIQVFSDLSVMP